MGFWSKGGRNTRLKYGTLSLANSRSAGLTYCKMFGSFPPSLSRPHPATMPTSPGTKSVCCRDLDSGKVHRVAIETGEMQGQTVESDQHLELVTNLDGDRKIRASKLLCHSQADFVINCM